MAIEPQPIDLARSAVNRLVAAAETLAAVGLALAQRAGDVTLPAEFVAGIDAVAASVLGDISELDDGHARALGALSRALLAQAAGFSSHPREPSAWAVTDPLVLQSLGQGSAALAAPVCDVVVARYPDLGQRLQQPGAAILDVGTGVGALAIAFATRYPDARVVGLDIWEPSLDLGRANVVRAGLTDRVEFRRQDVAALDDEDAFDLVWFAGPFIPGVILDEALNRVARATRAGGIVVYGTFGGADPLAGALHRRATPAVDLDRDPVGLLSANVHLNEYADGLEPLDMTATDEFASLCTSARDLGIAHRSDIRYVSRNIVMRHQRFHFLEWGDPANPPLLLLHGGNQSAHSWDLVSLHLADRWHVYALDQRGHGDSEWTRDSDYSSATMGLDAAQFIDALGLERLTVVGHSMGGQNAMRLAVAHPERVTALVLVDIGPEVSEIGAQVIRRFVTETREFDDIDHFVERVQAYDPYRPREHIERTVKYNLLRRADGKYISKHDHGPRLKATGEHRARGDLFTLDDVRDLPMPVLIVRGEDSNILTADGAQRFADALPHGRLVTVPTAGHNVHGQNTPGFIAAVVPFLTAS